MKEYTEKDLARMSAVELETLAREYLLTVDGAGKEQKSRILDELLNRWNACYKFGDE